MPHTDKFFRTVLDANYNTVRIGKAYADSVYEINQMMGDPKLSLVLFNHMMDHVADHLGDSHAKLIETYHDYTTKRLQFLQQFSAWSLKEFYYREGVWMN